MKKNKQKKASLQEVAEFLGSPYSTIVKWDKKKKEALRYGLPVIRELQKNEKKASNCSNH